MPTNSNTSDQLPPYIENPEAVGKPDLTPRVYMGHILLRCGGAISDMPEDTCSGVNGFHADGCMAVSA